MESHFACNMAALNDVQRDRHQELARRLRGLAENVVELPDGYAVRFPMDSANFLIVAEFVTLERLCCPFFTLAVESERDAGPLWLRVTGPDGIKPFIRAEFGLPDSTRSGP